VIKLSGKRHLNQHIVARHKPEAIHEYENREKKETDRRKSAEMFAGSIGAQTFQSYFKVGKVQRDGNRAEVRLHSQLF